MAAMLELNKVSTHYLSGGRIIKAVDNVDMRINEGEVVGLVGESGSGKSTLALSVLRLIDPPGKVYGEVLWNGINLLNLSPQNMRRIRGEEISMVFQDPFSSLNPVIKIGEQIAEVFRFHKKLSRRKAWEAAIKVLDLVHIKDPGERVNDYPHQFSGGMKQRVAVAMAYALSPKLLIADEPTTALDVTMQKAILELLKELKTGMLFITHNIALVSEMCSRMYVMKDGRIVEQGDTREVLGNPKDAYTKRLIDSYKEINLGLD